MWSISFSLGQSRSLSQVFGSHHPRWDTVCGWLRSSLREQDHDNIVIMTLFSGQSITLFAHSSPSAMPNPMAVSTEGDTRATGVFPLGQSPWAFLSSSCTLCPMEFPDDLDGVGSQWGRQQYRRVGLCLMLRTHRDSATLGVGSSVLSRMIGILAQNFPEVHE